MQNIFTKKKNARKAVLYSLLIALVFIKGTCIEKISFIQAPPAVVKANTNFTVKVLCNVTNGGLGDDTKKLVFAILVPKSWHVADNTPTLDYQSDIGNGKMSIIPSTVLIGGDSPKGTPALPYPAKLKQIHRIMGNVLDDHEWIAYQSNEGRLVKVQQKVAVTVTVNLKAGPDNMLTKLGFLCSFEGESTASEEGMKKIASDCVQVIDGVGDEQDFCNPPLLAISPVTGSDNDFYRVIYDNDNPFVVGKPITNSTDIYIKITKAHLTDGSDVTPIMSDEKSVLRPIELDKYTRMIWFRQLVGLTDDTKKIEYLECYIVDKAGNKVGFKGATDTPFTFRFKCN